MAQDNTIHLLLLNDSDNDAVEITNFLRNEGFKLRPKIVSNADDYRKALTSSSYDLILARPDVNGMDPAQALRIKAELKSDAGLIVIGLDDAEKKTALIKAGAKDVIPDEPEELTALIVEREYQAYVAQKNYSLLNKQLEDSEERCRQLIDSSRDAIAYVHDGMHILTNDPYYQMFKYESRDDIEAMPIMDLVTSEDGGKLKDFLRDYAKLSPEERADEAKNRLSVNGLREDGSSFKMKMEFLPATMSGEACTQIIIRQEQVDAKAQAELKAKIADLNIRDQETGLYNRSYFLKLLEEIAEKAANHELEAALLYISLDKFAALNDKLGVIAMDHVIADIANFLKENLDGRAEISRFESYRFAVILNDVDEKQAISTITDFIKSVSEHIADANGKSVTLTCSVGFYYMNANCGGSLTSLKRAQRACKTAIDNGGNQYHQYIPDATEMDDRELLNHWKNEIEMAIKQNRFFLVYQPLINLQGDAVETYEVFIRLKNQQGEMVNSDEFMSYAEKSGHFVHMDRWVIANAMEKMSTHDPEVNKTQFIIKLSSNSLADPKLVAWIKHNLERFKLNGQGFTFQITAHQAADNLKHVQTLDQQLKQLGCKTSIEHFGKEENAFNLLKHISADMLKLDFSLVNDIMTNVKHLEQVREICVKAGEMNIKTIIGFVEEAGSLSIVWQSGADFIQGNFLGPASEELDFDFSSFI